MKKITKQILIFVSGLINLTACDSFLDVVPDKRTEIDTNQKVSELLVSAYPNVDPMMIYEHRTDNAMDNGIQYGTGDRMLTENYFWRDVSPNGWDDPEQLWISCYKAIATTNQALEGIREIGESKENAPFKGEALLCRAYAHFLLANTFCQPYNALTASKDLGIPYVTEPEKKIGKTYERGTVQTVYENIANDIEEGYPLINDNAYAIPLYHFNKRAAAAFATRFYLFYGKYKEALKYASQAIPEDPSASLRNIKEYTMLAQASEWRDRFISKDEPANLLLIPLRSLWGRTYASRRYGNSDILTSLATYRSKGPWGDILEDFNLLFGASGYPVKFQPKYNEIFEITNQTSQTGQPHTVQMAFTVDETLLCRAEIYTLLKQYDKAAQDLSYWYIKKGGSGTDWQTIVQFYTAREAADNEAIQKKELHPMLALVKPFNAAFEIETGTQEKMLQGVLHARRIETMYSGLRWLDIRRYGIEVIHNVDGEVENQITLPAGDLRRVIQIPQSVTTAGMMPNPTK